MENKPIDTGPKKFPFFTVILIAFLAIILILSFTGTGNSKKEISQSEFFNQIETGKVAGVYLYGTTVYGITIGETTAQTEEKLKNFPKKYDFYFNIAFSSQWQKVQDAIDTFNSKPENVNKQIFYDTGIVQEPFFNKILAPTLKLE